MADRRTAGGIVIGWIILTAWVIGWLIFAPVIARIVAKDLNDLDSYDEIRDLDGFEKFSAVFLGGLAALFWPAVIPGGWVYRQVFGPRKKEEK